MPHSSHLFFRIPASISRRLIDARDIDCVKIRWSVNRFERVTIVPNRTLLLQDPAEKPNFSRHSA